MTQSDDVPDDLTIPDEVDRGLAFGYRAAPAPSVLDRIGAPGSRPAVSLRDADGGVPDPAGTLDPTAVRAAGRYVVQGVLGEGGVGVVHRGYDQDLGRDVAMKFLQERHRAQPDVLHRFVEEAQIGGQLQHPGIVPVYELGVADDRPFFAMKLIKGETLAARLAQRSDAADDRAALLAVFEDVCQTMAYAHARGVVHRDLKPANVMIGAFGEVQVVDWGMGKVLRRGGVADEQDPRPRVVETVRSAGSGSASVHGSVMGTPAYMPPEQARGAVDEMDERSDVFALGAILCQILTGEPPYVGPREELVAMAARADLDDARARLARCGADPELVALATGCLMPEPAARPRSAEPVALSIQAHRAGVEQRAHDATVRAATLRRTQKLGTMVLVVIAAGLATSLWSWSNERQARQEAQAAKTVAETNLRKFDLLSRVVRLETLRAAQDTLGRAIPENAPAMAAWLREARSLRDGLPELQATLAGIESRALPQPAAEAAEERRTHPRAAELELLRQRLASEQRAQRVRGGGPEPAAFVLDEEALSRSFRTLEQQALELVEEKRKVFGREAEGLALARRALARAPSRGSRRARVVYAVAQALLANGLDDAAIAHCEQAVETSREERKRYENRLDLMRAAVASRTGEAGRARLVGLADDLAKLEAAVARRRNWRFADPGDQFLQRTLDRLIGDVETFARAIPDVERQLFWAERVDALTLGRFEDRWARARAAIRAADGEAANRLYADPPLDLKPQRGLVPIGMNPVTKLWEFYHLRSAWDAAGAADPAQLPIPTHRADGRVDVAEGGIVFVLVPGGSFHMGAQARDPRGPNYDPHPHLGEVQMLVREVALAPYFLSKYELTNGQWSRLDRGAQPSFYKKGWWAWLRKGGPQQIGDDHPVDSVSFEMCDRVLGAHGLLLPTEAQWERACRGGTTKLWSAGDSPEDLEGFANVVDRSAVQLKPAWAAAGPERFADGYGGSAPVGIYRPNAFGLYDMHGNVHEWCRDRYGLYSVPARPGDGLREPPESNASSSKRVHRGGSYEVSALQARCAVRVAAAPTSKDDGLGVRPARGVDR